MTASNTALLVIDVQESFRHRPYWRDEDVVDFLSRQQALIDGAKAAGHAVVQIFHTDNDDAFRLDSGFVTTLAGLNIEPDVIIHKTRHSAFVGTPLEIWLRQRGIGRLIVSGIRTEQCCETTTRHASDLGWSIDYVTDATLTFDMLQPDGSPLSAADIKSRTATVLNGRFATLCTVEQALARAA